MLIKSKQPNLKFKRNSPKFEYSFANEPVEVKDEHFEILKKDYPNMFEVIKTKEVKK